MTISKEGELKMDCSINLLGKKYRPYLEAVVNCMNFMASMKNAGSEPPTYQLTYEMARNYYYYNNLTDEQKRFLEQSPETREFLAFSRHINNCFFDSLSEESKFKLETSLWA